MITFFLPNYDFFFNYVLSFVAFSSLNMCFTSMWNLDCNQYPAKLQLTLKNFGHVFAVTNNGVTHWDLFLLHLASLQLLPRAFARTPHTSKAN